MCEDGLDEDNDGKNDYPDDPGCSSPTDDDESDTCPGVNAGCPECADGIDNDGDGAVDEGCPAPPPADTTGPEVTLWNVMQNPTQYRFKLTATDPSGVATARVVFRNELVATLTDLPANVTVSLKKVPPGAHELRITVTDRLGNATVLTRTIMK